MKGYFAFRQRFGLRGAGRDRVEDERGPLGGSDPLRGSPVGKSSRRREHGVVVLTVGEHCKALVFDVWEDSDGKQISRPEVARNDIFSR